MSGQIGLDRSQAHNLANLLDEAQYPDGTARHSANIWIERLREEAGPVEPTSYAARVTIGAEEWARESASNSWWCLYSTREVRPGSAFLWNELIERAEVLDIPLEIKADGR